MLSISPLIEELIRIVFMLLVAVLLPILRRKFAALIDIRIIIIIADYVISMKKNCAFPFLCIKVFDMLKYVNTSKFIQ